MRRLVGDNEISLDTEHEADHLVLIGFMDNVEQGSVGTEFERYIPVGLDTSRIDRVRSQVPINGGEWGSDCVTSFQPFVSRLLYNPAP